MRSLFGNQSGPEVDRTRLLMGWHHQEGMIAFPMGEGKATPAAVEALGQSFGVIFPSEFIAHVCGEFPGIYVEVKEEIWPEAKAFDVRPFWAFLRGFHTFSPLSMSEDWMRLDHCTAQLQEHTGLQIAPVLKRLGDRNMVCADFAGALHELDHSTSELTPLGEDFWTVLDREWRELAARMSRFVAEFSREIR